MLQVVSLDLPPTASTKWLKRQPSHGVSEARQRHSSVQLLPNTRLCSPSSQRQCLWDRGCSQVGRVRTAECELQRERARGAGWGARPQGKLLRPPNAACYSDVPPVHVATDHEIGRAVPEVDAREVAERVPQLREAAFRFQAVHQDLGRKDTRRAVTRGGPAARTFHSAPTARARHLGSRETCAATAQPRLLQARH